MHPAAVAFVGFTLFAAVHVNEQPPVIAKMEEFGTVYVTRSEPPKAKSKSKNAKFEFKKNHIIGIDFRPMAGSDPKKVAEVIRELKTLPELQTVLLLGHAVTDEAADAIPASDKITSIRFYNSKIGDEGIGNLARFRRLADLNYTGTHLTDEGMKSIAQIRTLRSLTITDSPITDKGVMELRPLRFLQNLTIENSEASEKSIQELREQFIFLNGIRNFG